MANIFQLLGSVTGKFYNTHQAWTEAPEWVKQHYKLEQEQHCGDIDTALSGALKGALYTVAEFVKHQPLETANLGWQVAQCTGINEEYGRAFASGFMGTARFNGK